MRKKIICLALFLIASTCLGGCQSNISRLPSNITKEDSSLNTQESKTSTQETSVPKETTEEEFEIPIDMKTKTIILDGSHASTNNNTLYDGLGFISANNSSRLLMDYKTEHADSYWEILNYMFGSEGLNMDLIKIEMGSDVDSSSGTEPAMMRSASEIPDATRGAGAMIVHDALTIRPDLDVDMLYWGIPAWVMEAPDYNAAVYQWYKGVIEALYDEYGIQLTYLTVGQNERQIQPDLIKYVSQALKSEKDARYDYAKIQIVAGEGVGTWEIADAMLEDAQLREAVDVISSHYTSFSSDSAKILQAQYGKKIWFSEGSSPMKSALLTCHKEDLGNGISGLNGMLDIATRITQAITEGMTMYEFQPAVSAYYSGATYFPKQLLTANEPWSGAYSFDPGYFMGLHFAQFFHKGMQIIPDACFGDGVPGGDGHAITDSTFNHIAMLDADTKDYSVLFVNATNEPIAYSLELKNLNKASDTLWIYSSLENTDKDYYASFFQREDSIQPTQKEDFYAATLVVPAYSILTASTIEPSATVYQDRADSHTILSLPYCDDFEYADYEDNYLSMRGGAPRYTTDQGGAFEVENHDANHVLMQKITPDIKPAEWGSTSDPITTLGDDLWKDYAVSLDVHFADSEIEANKTNYVGIGLRYNLADQNQSGYILQLNKDGVLTLLRGRVSLAEVNLDSIDSAAWHTLNLTAIGNRLTAYVDGEKQLEYEDSLSLVYSGRAAIYSAYQNNYFDNLLIEATSDSYSIERIDDMDSSISFSDGTCEKTDEEGLWYFQTVSSFKNYNRTVSTGTKGCEFSFTFSGTEFALIGCSKQATLQVEIDGQAQEVTAMTADYRQAIYTSKELTDKEHLVTVKVLDGSIQLDAIERVIS